MGTLHPLDAKVQDYRQAISFKHIAILFEHLHLRQQYAEESSRYQNREVGLSHLEEINNRIMGFLNIPAPEKSNSRPSRLSDENRGLEGQKKALLEIIQEKEKALQLIQDFIAEVTGRIITPSMVQELCSNIKRTAAEALKK